jgi:sugar/nucleoside kinase (ribokinase family)
LITPDAARTMRTDLGAAAALAAEDLSPADFAGVECVYIEGYLLWNTALAERIFMLAQNAGCEICLNLGSFEMVRQTRPRLANWLKNYVDFVIGNLDEAREYFQNPAGNPKELAQSLMAICNLAVVTAGADGAFIAEAGENTAHCPARTPETLVDTTGAGDFWTAGFLYGHLRGWDNERCGQTGAWLAREIIAVSGVELPMEKWRALRKQIETMN